MNVLGRARGKVELFVWRHGWAWPLASFGIALALGAYVAMLVPARQALVQASLAVPAMGVPARMESPDEAEAKRLQAVRALLRSDAQPAQLIAQLHALATAAQLQVAQSDYSRHVHPGTGLVQVVVQQPVRASYAHVKRYIESVLREHPNASLDQIAARRENVGQTELEVRLRWTFWIDVGASGPVPAAQKASP